MDAITTLNLALAALVFVLSPGPANMAVLATSSREGFVSGFFLAVGEVIGAVVYLLIALFSLGALASVLTPIMAYVKLAGAAYLIYLGFKQFTAREISADASATSVARAPIKQILVGFLINGTNPKLVMFYLSFLPLFVDLKTLTPWIGAHVVIVVAASLLMGITLVCVMGQQLRRLLKSPTIARRVNRVSGLVMMGVGVSVARS